MYKVNKAIIEIVEVDSGKVLLKTEIDGKIIEENTKLLLKGESKIKGGIYNGEHK